jgi:hypothetical protein
VPEFLSAGDRGGSQTQAGAKEAAAEEKANDELGQEEVCVSVYVCVCVFKCIYCVRERQRECV